MIEIGNKKILQLVASGCSFTRGNGCNDLATESWPAQLSKRLDLNCINLGQSGMGNEHVLRTIINYFAQNPEAKEYSLVILCFSSISRIEFPKHQKVNIEKFNVWTTLPRIPAVPERKPLEDFIVDFFENIYDDHYYYNRYLRIIISLQAILDSYGIPYIMLEALKNPHKEMLKYSDSQKLIKQINQDKWLWFFHKCIDSVVTDRNERSFDSQHLNAAGYKKIADHLYNYIIKNYNVII
jgi:hypothetical protein